MNAPLVFVSYSHDSDEHKAWVRKLATDLRANGVDIILDQWDLALGQDVSAFMQRGVARSERVLLICSEAFVRKADSGSGGVGYERLVVTVELVQNIDTKKFIPLIRDNPSATKTPAFLAPRRYIDFSRDEDYPAKLGELLREIHGGPSVAKPPLGPSPFSGAVFQGQPVSRVAGPTGLTASGQPVLDEAWFTSHGDVASNGLGKLGLKSSMELRYALHDAINKSQLDLLNAVRKSEIRTFGWPIAVLLENRDDYRPRPVADGIRAEIAIEERPLHGSRSYDYWSLRSNGDFYLLKSLFEDERGAGKIFFNTRIVRVTESILFAANLYENLGVPPETRLSLRVTHRGLAGRELSTSNPSRDVTPGCRATEDLSQAQIVEALGQMRMRLIENVRQIAEPLFMLFDFKQFAPRVYEEIVTNFVAGHVT